MFPQLANIVIRKFLLSHPQSLLARFLSLFIHLWISLLSRPFPTKFTFAVWTISPPMIFELSRPNISHLISPHTLNGLMTLQQTLFSNPQILQSTRFTTSHFSPIAMSSLYILFNFGLPNHSRLALIPFYRSELLSKQIKSVPVPMKQADST